MSDTHKKSETNQQVSDFHISEGSVNGSLTDRHYRNCGSFFISGSDLLNGHRFCQVARLVH
ncbi:MAG: hypothetical protein ACRC1N_06975, partial [Aeromonas sobria]